MKLFVLGATGGIGRALLSTALERGHEVTAYVRSPQKIETTHDRLRKVQGDVFDSDQMAQSMARHEVVLSAFGPLTVRACTLRREFGGSLVAAMQKSGVHRAEVVSAAFLFRDVGLLGAMLKATLFRQMIPDMAGMEAGIARSDLDWTLVRPPRLTNGPARHAYRMAIGELPQRGFTISRADVAHYLIVEAESPTSVRQIVGLAD